MHERNSRFNKSFVYVNISSINPVLIEAELFGYKKGTLTGASTEGKEGIFEWLMIGSFFS